MSRRDRPPPGRPAKPPDEDALRQLRDELREATREGHAVLGDLNRLTADLRKTAEVMEAVIGGADLTKRIKEKILQELDSWQDTLAEAANDSYDRFQMTADQLLDDVRDAVIKSTRFGTHQQLLDHIITEIMTQLRDLTAQAGPATLAQVARSGILQAASASVTGSSRLPPAPPGYERFEPRRGS